MVFPCESPVEDHAEDLSCFLVNLDRSLLHLQKYRRGFSGVGEQDGDSLVERILNPQLLHHSCRLSRSCCMAFCSTDFMSGFVDDAVIGEERRLGVGEDA